jgi:hypothetical protein
MHPRTEMFAAFAVLAGGVAGLRDADNDAIGGIERTSVGSARIAITSMPMNALCLRLTVTGSRTDVQTFPVGPGADAEFELDALPVGRDSFLAEAFSVPCANVTEHRAPRGQSESTAGLISAGDTARVDLVMSLGTETRVADRLGRP